MSQMNVRLSTTKWTIGLLAVGVLVIALGSWGAIVSVVGPLIHFGLDTHSAWSSSEQHWTLSLGPGIALVVAGLALVSGEVGWARAGALLAVTAGAWFIVGPYLHGIWSTETQAAAGAGWKRALLWIGWYAGVGALACTLGAYALGLLARQQLQGAVAILPSAPSTATGDGEAPGRAADAGPVGATTR